jgi:hypothetical protein
MSEISDLVRQYFEAGEVQNLITLFTAMKEQRDRAELAAASRLHEIKKLAEAFATLNKPIERSGERRVAITKPDQARPTTVKPSVKPTKSSVESLEL